MVVDQIGSVTELVAAQGVNAVVALGAVIGEDAALRVMNGGATVCDVILASWALGVDSVQAVADYAAAALGSAVDGAALGLSTDEASDSRCA